MGLQQQDNAETHLAKLDAEQGNPDLAASDFHHIGGPYVDMPLMINGDNKAR